MFDYQNIKSQIAFLNLNLRYTLPRSLSAAYAKKEESIAKSVEESLTTQGVSSVRKMRSHLRAKMEKEELKK